MNITQIVKNKRAHFIYFRDGNFIYRTDDGFQFPVPLAEIGNATLLAEDKALFFMRWIRKHLETIQNESAVLEASTNPPSHQI